jgi:hypothetical protein
VEAVTVAGEWPERLEGRVYSADGVDDVSFVQESPGGSTYVNDGTVSMRPGDFLDLGAIPGRGTFTLRLEASPVPPDIAQWLYGIPPHLDKP